MSDQRIEPTRTTGSRRRTSASRAADAAAAQLSPCPRFPWSCVSSRDDAGRWQRVEPLAVPGDPSTAFERLKDIVAALPRIVIVTATDTYLHAECRSPRGFVDDLECRLCPSGRVIHVRSASRFAVWDLGVNRARVETLRRRLVGAETER